jgi:hypothetical protein
MARLADCDYGLFQELPRRLSERLEGATDFASAAQRGAELLYEELAESIVLTRVYVTVPWRELPAPERAYVLSVVEGSSDASALGDGTPVLSLMGTRGARPEWNDRRRSRSHLGIPLLRSRYVEGIAMIARLMTQMGIGLDWIDRGDAAVVYRILGKVAGLFFVEEAGSAIDHLGRKIIPAQEFVREHGVRTVFGFGGGYADGTFAALIAFCREPVARAQAERMMPCFNAVKAATMEAVKQRRFFD